MKDMEGPKTGGKMTGESTGVAKCELGDGSKIDKLPYGEKTMNPHPKKKGY